MKEFCESELCDLKFGCTWQIARCRISSMPPFNWHFLPPTVSCHFFSPPSKKWHWTDNSTAAFCQRHFHLWMLPFALHAMLVLLFNLSVFNGISCKAFCFLIFTCWSIQKTRDLQKCWDDERIHAEVRPCRIPQRQCRPGGEYWPHPGGRCWGGEYKKWRVRNIWMRSGWSFEKKQPCIQPKRGLGTNWHLGKSQLR